MLVLFLYSLDGLYGRDDDRSNAAVLIGRLAISHDRNLQGHHRIVNPAMPALHG
jgi:hypothetical protein